MAHTAVGISESVKAIHFADVNAPICRLEVKKHFETLTEKEKLYAHYISRASWEGTKVLAGQLSEESPVIFDLLMGILRNKEDSTKVGDLDALRQVSGVSEEDFKLF